MKRKNYNDLPNIRCDRCGYQNHADNVAKYGTCKLCGNVLDAKAKYKYEMYIRLRMWRKK